MRFIRTPFRASSAPPFRTPHHTGGTAPGSDAATAAPHVAPRHTRNHAAGRRAAAAGLAVVASLTLTGCLAGEGRGSVEGVEGTTGEEGVLDIDYATYNPLSLVIRDHGWLEEELAEQDLGVNWVFSAGSNRANELLRAEAIDIGSTAGSAALLNRSNGAPTKLIAITNQPEWAAFVVPEGSEITEVSQLADGDIAATRGTDPFFFAIQALQQAGVDPSDVTVQNLQHADGRTAMEAGSVDAWAGLDPIMAAAEHDGAELFYRDISLNTYSVLNATEEFIEQDPEVVQTVLDTYERARQWALENPEETAQILADEAGIELEVARTVIDERTNLDVTPVPGEEHREVLSGIGPILVSTGDVDYQEHVDEALDTLFEPRFAEEATR